MKPIVIETNIIKLFNITGIALFPFIIILKGTKNNKELINHETIHFHQQKELWVIPFYILYLIEHIKKGYYDISFEREAFANESDYQYLKNRKKDAWKKYIKK